jgi:hypothetical protein
MINFAPGEGSTAYVAASLQRVHVSPVTAVRGDVVGVLWVEQDKS